MSWIESHQSLGRHPKLIALAARLDVSRPTSVGHLQYLWWWSVDYAPDGDLTKYDDATIAGAAEWPTDPQFFVASLRETGWLDDGFLHDWPDYAGRLIERRKADAARKRATRTSDGRPVDGARTAHVPTYLPTDLTPTSGAKRMSTGRPPDGAPSANGAKRDEFFEATVEVCGIPPEGLTAATRNRIGKFASEARAAGANPKLIRGFAVVWGNAHPDIPVSIGVLANHWGDYMAGRIEPLPQRRRA